MLSSKWIGILFVYGTAVIAFEETQIVISPGASLKILPEHVSKEAVCERSGEKERQYIHTCIAVGATDRPQGRNQMVYDTICKGCTLEDVKEEAMVQNDEMAYADREYKVVSKIKVCTKRRIREGVCDADKISCKSNKELKTWLDDVPLSEWKSKRLDYPF